MDKYEINKLVKGLLASQLNWEEKKKLSQYRLIEDRMKQQWKHTTTELMEAEMQERIWKRIIKNRKPIQARKYAIYKFVIAASVLLFIIGGSLWLLKHNSTLEYIDFTAEKAILYILPDSTHVWMQPKSKICYAKKFNHHRELWLKGDALFDVTKGKENNFKVHIPKAFIEVKGTSFRIKSCKTGKNEITLFEGKIDFNIENTSSNIVMKPMDKIIYNPETTEITMQKIEHINWKNGRYIFTDITIEKLINIINEQYNSRIMLGKNINNQYRYTGSLNHNEKLEDVINKLCYSMNLKAETKGEEILIH